MTETVPSDNSHQVEILPNLVTIVSNPNDFIATQVITGMETHNEDNDADLCGMEQANEATSAMTVVIPVCSPNDDQQEVVSTDNSQDENVPTTSTKRPASPGYQTSSKKHASTDNSQDENVPTTSTKRPASPGYQTSSKKHASTAMKFKKFRIDWSKVSDSLLTRLNTVQDYRLKNPNAVVPRDMKITKLHLKEVINVVVNQLRNIDTEISATTMEAVAIQMMTKYPCLEIVDDDGFGNGLTFKTVKSRMVYRNTYCTRLAKEAQQASKPAPQTKHRQAGTLKSYWKATADKCSNEVLSKLRRDEPVLLTDDFLSESQKFVRSRFNQKKELKLILSEFPVLRRRPLLNYHFKQATGIDVETLRAYFSSKRARIIGFSAKKKTKLNEASSDYEVFEFLAKLVGESLSDLILKKELGTRIDELRDDSSGPVLICIDIGNGSMYYVFAENTRLSEGTTDFICAIQDLMCVQYVHSFMYLKKAEKFLELVQQYLLKIFPDQGSRSTAVKIGQQQRTVQNVIESLSNYE